MVSNFGLLERRDLVETLYAGLQHATEELRKNREVRYLVGSDFIAARARLVLKVGFHLNRLLTVTQLNREDILLELGERCSLKSEALVLLRAVAVGPRELREPVVKKLCEDITRAERSGKACEQRIACELRQMIEADVILVGVAQSHGLLIDYCPPTTYTGVKQRRRELVTAA